MTKTDINSLSEAVKSGKLPVLTDLHLEFNNLNTVTVTGNA